MNPTRSPLRLALCAALLVSSSSAALACTGSANDPPHCINNGQAINGFTDFYNNNLQPSPGGLLESGSNRSKYFEEFLGTELVLQKRFSDRWSFVSGSGANNRADSFGGGLPPAATGVPSYYDFGSIPESGSGAPPPTTASGGTGINIVTRRGSNAFGNSTRSFFSNDSLGAEGGPQSGTISDNVTWNNIRPRIGDVYEGGLGGTAPQSVGGYVGDTSSGGALTVDPGRRFDRNTPAGNVGSNQGGGIYVPEFLPAPTLSGSTITGNTASGTGGALWSGGPAAAPPLPGEKVGGMTWLNRGTTTDLTIVRQPDGKHVGVGPDGHVYGEVRQSRSGFGWRFEGPVTPPQGAGGIVVDGR